MHIKHGTKGGKHGEEYKDHLQQLEKERPGKYKVKKGKRKKKQSAKTKTKRKEKQEKLNYTKIK